ncbi:hypothetical protein K440DRAFT_665401 [Wilcoxina mikolae CBS 423.85]|nr:hypothetical protein K440DRAFT_665401 [Wilcoxina mikolae CBS 423.85]
MTDLKLTHHPTLYDTLPSASPDPLPQLSFHSLQLEIDCWLHVGPISSVARVFATLPSSSRTLSVSPSPSPIAARGICLVLKLFHNCAELPYFDIEADAYERLNSSPATVDIVPHCYGWLETPAGLDIPASDSDSDSPSSAPERGLLLEYICDASPLHTIPLPMPTAVAHRILHGLVAIHSAGVLHNDAEARNILITPGGKVVWVDFDRASVAADDGLSHMKEKSGFVYGNVYKFEWRVVWSLLWRHLGVQEMEEEKVPDVYL